MLKGVTAKMGKGCCQKFVNHTLGPQCGGEPCPDHQVMGLPTKASCQACFKSGSAWNCSQISFCTKTKFGQDVWCGPTEPKYCMGTNIIHEAGCGVLED